MKSKVLAVICVIGLAISAAACGGSTPSAPSTLTGGGNLTAPQSVAGTYHLSQINGQSLPAFIDNGHEQWTAATMTVNQDGTITGTISWREYNGAALTDQGTDNFSGSYKSTGANTLLVTIADDPAAPATVTSSTITINQTNPTLTLVFAR